MSNLYVIRVDTNTTLDFGYDTYLVDASANNVELTLPEASGDGPSFIISRIDNSTNTVSIAPGTGSNLNGSTSAKTLGANENVRLVLQNNDWYTILGKWLL